MEQSELVSMSEPGRLELRRVLPSTPERVWAYLVQGELRQKWLCGGTVEPRPGGSIVFDFDHSRISQSPPPDRYADQCKVRLEGEVLVYDEPNHLAFTWPETNAGISSKVTIRLKAVAAGVELHLVHERVHDPDDQIGAAAGWHAHFDLLEDLLSERAVSDFWPRHTQLEAEYRIRFQGESR